MTVPDEILILQANGWAVVGTAPPPEEEKTYATLNGDREIFTPEALEWKPEPTS